MNESVVNVSELTRRFGARTALASVSLSMSRGAVYGLVGANGAGKTTLIKHLLGLLRAERGSSASLCHLCELSAESSAQWSSRDPDG